MHRSVCCARSDPSDRAHARSELSSWAIVLDGDSRVFGPWLTDLAETASIVRTGYAEPYGPSSDGYRLRALTAAGEIDGPQVTSAYASGGAHDYKRVAIPLPSGVTAADITGFRFDAYDNDGIYLTAIGDAFTAQLDATNGATLTYVRKGERALTYYVDDDRSSCSNNVNTDGPGGTAYTCTGSYVDVPK